MISVVIPTHNRAELVKRAISSVIDQTYADWELIIVDDASTDDTQEVIKCFQKDCRIKYIKIGQNGGNAVARNTGVRAATYEIISFLDSDDVYQPDFLEKMLALIESSSAECGFFWTNVFHVDIKGAVYSNAKFEGWLSDSISDKYAHFLKGLRFGTDFGFTIKKDCFYQVGGFDSSLRVSVDTDFILRAVQYHDCNYIDVPLVATYDHHGTRVRRNYIERAKSYVIMYEKHREKIEQSTLLKNLWSYKLMWLHYHAKNKPAARKYLATLNGLYLLKGCFIGTLFEFSSYDFAVKTHKWLTT